MSILKIFTQGSPVLRKKAKAVSKILPVHLKLIDEMLETMRQAPGIGLAAPQVGISERIIVVELEDKSYCVINPKIAKKSGKIVCSEGCLSVPGLEAPVERSEKITVKGTDKKGKQISINAEGLLAVVFQHEIDHLDGLLFIDRVKNPSLITFKKIDKLETI